LITTVWRLRAPHFIADLPAGGRRIVQEADGYLATIKAGETIFENGQPTGAMPGKLVRGPQRCSAQDSGAKGRRWKRKFPIPAPAFARI
jgi:N-acyl-D-aspartate/D-glutamate deacylase